MAIDHDTTTEKHIITQYNNLIQGRLMAVTYCGWTYIGTKMEGAHGIGNWWKNPKLIPHMCPGCVHVADCKHADPDKCAKCEAASGDTHPVNR